MNFQWLKKGRYLEISSSKLENVVYFEDVDNLRCFKYTFGELGAYQVKCCDVETKEEFVTTVTVRNESFIRTIIITGGQFGVLAAALIWFASYITAWILGMQGKLETRGHNKRQMDAFLVSTPFKT